MGQVLINVSERSARVVALEAGNILFTYVNRALSVFEKAYLAKKKGKVLKSELSLWL